MAYTEPQERRKQRANRRRDQIKFIDLRFERWQGVIFRKAKRRPSCGKI